MTCTRRSAIMAGLAAALASHPLVGCGAGGQGGEARTRVHVMGVIHSNHRRSERYSLKVLEAAIRKAAPDIILTEIPPDRIGQALRSFGETGRVVEPRTQVFPEYTDVIVPLGSELGFEIVGTSAWTSDIAEQRRRALDRIRSDPDRAAQWAQHRAAEREYARRIGGRGDDPLFIHTREFDRLVEDSRRPYQRNFDADLGPGGWTQINRAHTALIEAALDAISGRGMTALVTFGTAHKYKILRSLESRFDVELLDTGGLFR